MVGRSGWCVLALWLALWLPARADDALAKQHFEAGVSATSQNHWDEAAQHFEASLAESDKPATRFNLMLTHQELNHPLEVARHALAFLASAGSPGREEARAKADALLREAMRALTVLDVSALPQDVKLQIDGATPTLRDGVRIYVLPGVHHLQLGLGPHFSESIEISLGAGQTLPWPRLGRIEPETAPPLAADTRVSSPKRSVVSSPKVLIRPDDGTSLVLVRTRAAWTLGTVGAALAVAAAGCLWVTEERGDKLAHRGIAGAQRSGYVSASNRYWNSFNAFIPLAVGAGVLMTGAVAISGRMLRRGSLAWSIASLIVGGGMLGAGTFLLVREPHAVIATTPIQRPSREIGGLLVASASPFVTYGIGFPITRQRDARISFAGLTHLRVTW